MGVVNVTPDSFWAGSRRPDPDSAVAQARRMVAAGAAILDLGAESTRPGHERVPAAAQLERLLPVLRGIVAAPPPIADAAARQPEAATPPILSIDTTLAEVAEAALDAGAHWVNDTSALQQDPDLGRVVAERGCPLVLMHRMDPARPVEAPASAEVLVQVRDGLRAGIDRALGAGCRAEQLILDPGLGFGLSYADNAMVIARLAELQTLGLPLLVGPSRKRFVGHFTGREVEDRLFGTAATVAALSLAGADVIRVHDVEAAVDVVAMADAIRREAAG